MEKLKPCPVCGGTDIEKERGFVGYDMVECDYAVRCKTCGLSHYDPSGGGPWNWNTRPIEDKAKQLLIQAGEYIKKHKPPHADDCALNWGHDECDCYKIKVDQEAQSLITQITDFVGEKE